MMLETITRTLWGRVGCPPPYMKIVPLVCLSAAFTLIDIVFNIDSCDTECECCRRRCGCGWVLKAVRKVSFWEGHWSVGEVGVAAIRRNWLTDISTKCPTIRFWNLEVGKFGRQLKN